MKLHPMVFVLVLLLVAGVGFGAGMFVQGRSAPVPQQVAPEPLSKADSTWEEKKAVHRKVLIDYLDGKELSPVDGKPLGAVGKPPVFRKADIEAVQFGDSASKSGDTPWSTSVTVLATLDGKRYSVHARMEYREIENSIVIVSFKPTEVSPQ